MFSKYRKLNEIDSIKYVRQKMDIFGADEAIKSEEVGNGNINYIYRIVGEDRSSVILKQADNKLRSSGRDLDRDRIRIEAEALMLEEKLATGMVPKVYFYDSDMSCIVMEDLSDYEIMRDTLVNYNVWEGFSENITDFLVKTTLPTTDVVLEQIEKKNRVKQFINPEMCDISERLVFSQPFKGHKENKVTLENQKFVEDMLYNDEIINLEVAKLKYEFMTNAQALIHGDLHTGSIFIKEDIIKIFDSEFAFYGPIGYDVGNVIANLFFPYIRLMVLVEDYKSNKDFELWIRKTIKEVADKFKEKSLNYIEENKKEKMSQIESFSNWYIDQIMRYTAGVTGLEIIRRIVGSAKVDDIESIKNNEDKAKAERIAVKIAKKFILNRKELIKGKDYLNIFDKVLDEEL